MCTAQTHLENWTDTLQESLDFHSSSLFTREPVAKAPSNQSAAGNIDIAVHSLDLHLQAALRR